LFLAVSLIAILLIILRYRKDFSLMVLGDELSAGLGANVDRARKAGLLVVVIGTGISVSVIGNVGFVGLCIPHIARLLFGSRFSYLLPAVAVMSAFLLGAADFMARSVSTPLEIPVGAITALIGAPFFLYLAKPRKSTEGGLHSETKTNGCNGCKVSCCKKVQTYISHRYFTNCYYDCYFPEHGSDIYFSW